jgi:hypothetical protein
LILRQGAAQESNKIYWVLDIIIDISTPLIFILQEKECNSCGLYPLVLLAFKNQCLACGLDSKSQPNEMDRSILNRYVVQRQAVKLSLPVRILALANQVLSVYQKQNFCKQTHMSAWHKHVFDIVDIKMSLF